MNTGFLLCGFHVSFNLMSMKMICHNTYMNMVSLVWIRSCPFKYDECKNDFSQYMHEYGFAAVWIRSCLFNADDCENDFSQYTHEYGFTPVWVRS